MMATMLLSLLLLMVVGWSVAIPLQHDEEDSVSIEAGNSLEEESEFESYFATVSEILQQASGEPTSQSGVLVSNYNDSSKGNPEEWGEYFQGDILVPKSLGRNGLVSESARWPGGVVPFEIDNTFSPADLNMIEGAFNEYHRRTCVKFVPRYGQNDYIRLTKENTGCWSSVGRIGGMQEVNLQSPGCVTKIGTVIHELMHAVGFMHEQNRSERDSYVTIMWGNIERGRENNFELAKRGTVNGFGVTYDYGSVMHYSDYAFSVNDSPTIVAKAKGVTMGQREGFSSGDVQKIRAMYKCDGASSSSPCNTCCHGC